MCEVLLERLQGGGVAHPLPRRSPEHAGEPRPTLPVPVDRPGERLAIRVRDASLQVQVSDDVAVGRALAVFFLAVFPGNVYQAVAGISTAGLRTPAERWARIAAEPLLIARALWSTQGS